MGSMQFEISEEEFLVRSHEIDRYKKATLSAMVGYLQEAAWQNSAELGASVYDLQKLGVSLGVTKKAMSRGSAMSTPPVSALVIDCAKATVLDPEDTSPLPSPSDDDLQ